MHSSSLVNGYDPLSSWGRLIVILCWRRCHYLNYWIITKTKAQAQDTKTKLIIPKGPREEEKICQWEEVLPIRTIHYVFSSNWSHVMSLNQYILGARMAQWVRSLDLTAHTSLSPIRRGFAPSFVNYKKGALDSQPQVIKFTSCLPRVGGSLRFPPPLKLVAMV